MAVKTFNPAGSTGNWSTASAWGGSIPADGDSFVISTGKTCYMDVDQSAMGTGMIAGTVNGTLGGPNGAGTGILKMDGVAGHDITIAANGSLIHGTSKASPAASNSIFKINLGTASNIWCAGNDRTIRLHPTMKTIRHCNLTADAIATATAIVVDKTNAQLQADGWNVGDYISVARPTTSSSPNQQLFTIASWGGGSTINLSGALSGGTYIIGSYVVNHTSNIMFLCSRTSGLEEIFHANYNCPILDIGANIINTSVVTGYTNVGGIGIYTYMNSLGRGEFYGTMHGMVYGTHYCRGLTYTRAYFTGCNTALSKSIKCYVDIMSIGTYIALASTCSDSYITPESVIFGNCYSVGGYGNMQFGGKIKGCLEAFIGYNGSVLDTADIGGVANIDKNSNGSIDFADGGNIVLNGAMLQDSTKVFTYKNVVQQSNIKSCVAMYNYASSIGTPQFGQHWFYTTGGYTYPTTDSGFISLGYPSVEKMVFEWSSNLNYVDLPVDLVSGQPFYMVIDVQLGSDLYTWIESPSIVIVNPNKPFESAEAVLATAVNSIGVGINTIDPAIQRLYISFVPTPTATFPYGSHKPAFLRVKGKAGNASGTGTDFLLFAYSQTQASVADVRSLNGSSSDLSNLVSRIDAAISTRLAPKTNGRQIYVDTNGNVNLIDAPNSLAVDAIATAIAQKAIESDLTLQQAMQLMTVMLTGTTEMTNLNDGRYVTTWRKRGSADPYYHVVTSVDGRLEVGFGPYVP